MFVQTPFMSTLALYIIRKAIRDVMCDKIMKYAHVHCASGTAYFTSTVLPASCLLLINV